MHNLDPPSKISIVLEPFELCMDIRTLSKRATYKNNVQQAKLAHLRGDRRRMVWLSVGQVKYLSQPPVTRSARRDYPGRAGRRDVR